MCDTAAKATGWRGWMKLGKRPPGPALGPWFDLSHPLNEHMPTVQIFPAPRFWRLKQIPPDPMNVTMMEMAVHSGTHVDAPRHFFVDGPAFHEVPLDRLHGPGVVLNLEKEPDSVIGADDLANAKVRVEPGDIVALHTGWWRHAGTPHYHHHPCLSVEAAHWLVEKQVKLLACDFATPDLPIHRRSAGFDWPVHHILLGSGVLVSEHLTNHAELADRRAEFMFLALNISDSDGAPARVVARRLS